MILVVAAALVDDLTAPTKVLAARRRIPAELAGQWEFPGGKVNPGESPLAALRRELAEELGVAIVVDEELRNPEGRCWPISDDYEMRLWLGRITDGTPRPGPAHDALSWRRRGDLDALAWLGPDVLILPVLSDRLKGPLDPYRRPGWASGGRPPPARPTGRRGRC